MSNINQIIQEVSMADITDHLSRHGKKYLIGALALGAGAAAHKGYSKYKEHQAKKLENTRNAKILRHLVNNRGIYGGATLGAISSLASSHGKPLGTRLKNAAIFTASGGLAGAVADNARRNSEHAHNIEMVKANKKK